MRRISDAEREKIREAVAKHPSIKDDPFAFNRVIAHVQNGLIEVKEAMAGAFD